MTDKKDSSVNTGLDLTNQLLVAMPGVVGGSLADTVIYICEHNAEGALGLVINRPTDITVGDLLQRIELDLSLEIGPVKDTPVFFGGPVQTDRGFVLHMAGSSYSSSLDLGTMRLTTSRDILEDVSQGNAPSPMAIYLGYAGWGAGQLEDEMADNAWLNVDSNHDLLFNVPAKDRYKHALKQLGIDPYALVGNAGRA